MDDIISTYRVIDYNIVVFCIYWLLYKRFIEDDTIYHNTVILQESWYLSYPDHHPSPAPQRQSYQEEDFCPGLHGVASQSLQWRESWEEKNNSLPRLLQVLPVHFSPVLDSKLWLKVVDHQGLPQVSVGDGLLQGEPLGVEGDQAVTQWPVFHRLLHHQAGFVNETQMQDYTSRITFSVKIQVLIYSNSSSLVKISFIGLLRVFFSMAHTPTTTCSTGWNMGTRNKPSCKLK